MMNKSLMWFIIGAILGGVVAGYSVGTTQQKIYETAEFCRENPNNC